MPKQLGSRYRFRLITESGGVNPSGTVTNPCPTAGNILGGINYCNYDDYQDWLRASELQNSEIQRKENEIDARGFAFSEIAESYKSLYQEAYSERESVILNPLDTRDEVNDVIAAMEVGASYEDALAMVLEENGIDADTFNAIKKKGGIFTFQTGASTFLVLAAAGVGFAYLSGRFGRR